jgi:RNA polymerase sigma factor (sigma-70 family)
LIDYLELVNIGNHTLYILFKNNKPEQYNKSYLSTAIKWAIRNEVRRRYKWYSLRQKRQASEEDGEDIREAVYKTILSIDEMADADNPTQIRDESKSPEECLEFLELKSEIVQAIKKLPQRERDLIESKFFKDKKLRELSDEFSISSSRISRIIQTGLNRIKKDLSKQNML